MEDIRFNGQLNFEIKEPGFVQVQRNAMYRYPFKNGKPTYSFIFVQKGEMLYHFLSSKKKILIEKNTCLFLPGTGEEIAKTHVALLTQLKSEE
jgi:hypothetical protein